MSTRVHACVCVCAYTDTYIAFIMLYTQTYILYLTSCTYYIKYCVIIISINYYTALLVKILYVLVGLVISPSGFREDLRGHNYVFSVLSVYYIQCCDQNKVLFYSIFWTQDVHMSTSSTYSFSLVYSVFILKLFFYFQSIHLFLSIYRS